MSLDAAELAPPDVGRRPSVSAVGRDDQWAYYDDARVRARRCSSLSVVLVRSRFGRALIAVRDHEAAAQTVGINLASVKVLAFALSALYAGIAGRVGARRARNASADKVETFQLSIEFLVAVVIGGTATVLGPLIGGFVVVFIQHRSGEPTQFPTQRRVVRRRRCSASADRARCTSCPTASSAASADFAPGRVVHSVLAGAHRPTRDDLTGTSTKGTFMIDRRRATPRVALAPEPRRLRRRRSRW